MTLAVLPVTVALDLCLGWLFASDDLAALQMLLGPTTTIVAWALAALTALCCLVALVVGRVRRDAFGVGAFLLTSSLAQAPAMLASFTPLVGAQRLPALLAAGAATLSVALLAWRLHAGAELAEGPRATP
jgi:hypothetical protein